MQLIWVVTSGVFGGVVGGLIGAFTSGYRLGTKLQHLDDRVAANEKRLEKGDPHVEDVPVLRARIDAVLAAIQELKVSMKDARQEAADGRKVLHEKLEDRVTHEECDRRHPDDARGHRESSE